jgi:iron complex transport system ATP-binding protein
MKVEAREVSWIAGRRPVVDGVSLEVRPGEFFGVVGPNGSGKSTLLSLLAGLRRPATGAVTFDGAPIGSIGRRPLARLLALVEQQADTAERLTGRQVVELGRTPYLSALEPWSARDDAIIERALVAVDMAGRAGRLWHTLSGGERQRLHIARALAQEPRVLLLDEPTNHLDVEHQIGLLDLVRGLRVTVVAVLHDLNHALMFCDRVAVLRDGRLDAIGAPAEVLTRRRLADVFRVEAEIRHDGEGAPFIRYLRPGASAVRAVAAA